MGGGVETSFNLQEFLITASIFCNLHQIFLF